MSEKLTRDSLATCSEMPPGNRRGVRHGGTSSSPALIKSIIMNSMPGIPRLAFSAVDMKDVVQAHIKGLFLEEAANQRFIVVKENVWLVNICQMVQ